MLTVVSSIHDSSLSLAFFREAEAPEFFRDVQAIRQRVPRVEVVKMLPRARLKRRDSAWVGDSRASSKAM